MKKISIFLLLIGFAFTATAQFKGKTTEEKIENIIKELTLEEKVAMCHAQSKFSTPGVERLGIPEIWMSDGPHGVRPELQWDSWSHANWTNDSATAFPALSCLAATFNPELSKEYGIALGEESRYREKDIILGPGVNIYRTPLNGRNFEYMGEDPYLASKMVVPYIKGVQQNGVAACVKHYVLNNQEKWRGHINVKVSDRALHEIYLPAFKAAVQEGEVWSIMGAYNQYKKQFCSHNEILINKILKGDWGFDGVVVTDWGAAHDMKQSALNGLDIEMGTWTDGLNTNYKNAYDNYFLAQPFLNAIKSGEIKEEVVDEKVRRILRLMFRTSMNNEKPLGRMNNPEHHQVAREVGNEGIVLLKNEGNFYPIDPNKKIKIAVIGENATRVQTTGGGSSELKVQFEISPLEGIKQRFKNAEITYARGYGSYSVSWGRRSPSKFNADSLLKEALEVAKKADIVLFVGGLNKDYFQDSEGIDRLQYELPYGQNEIIEEILKVNQNLGVVVVSGNAVAMPWLGNVKSVLQTWFLGSMAGTSIADVVSGDVNPSGKLPFTYPVNLTDNSAHHFGTISYPGDSIDQEYKEGILVGYRWHDTKKIKPLFAFGHGLSYSTFKISEIKADKKKYKTGETIKVSLNIENTGSFDGAEVVQVYVGKSKSKVERALKELKAFNKVFLKKGESKSMVLEIKVEDLAYYNEEKSDWTVEEGGYVIYVGNASDNITEKIKISVE